MFGFGFKFDENGNLALNEHYTEIVRLHEMLSDANIPHEFRRMFDGYQIIYPGEVRVSDAIQHGGSYGSDQNLVEIMGLTESEDGVEGYLTAEDVFERYSRHYAETYLKGGAENGKDQTN